MPNNTDFIEKLHFLEGLYVKSREAIALLENYDPSKRSHAGPHNELRSALDHIMRMVKGEENGDYEIEYRGAKSHLLRAGYDSYELICMFCIQKIDIALNGYSRDDIVAGFPEYLTVIKPDVIEIQKEAAELRANKKNSPIDDNFAPYFECSEKLITHIKDINKHLPVIHELFVKRKNQERRKTVKEVVIGVVIAGFFFILGFFL